MVFWSPCFRETWEIFLQKPLLLRRSDYSPRTKIFSRFLASRCFELRIILSSYRDLLTPFLWRDVAFSRLLTFLRLLNTFKLAEDFKPSHTCWRHFKILYDTSKPVSGAGFERNILEQSCKYHILQPRSELIPSSFIYFFCLLSFIVIF